MRERSEDPYASHAFRAEIDGLIVAGFAEVKGIDSEMEVQEVPEGGENGFVHQLLGRKLSSSRLQLGRGLADTDALWNWHQEATTGTIERRDISVLVLDEANGSERWRWVFAKAVPVKWSGPELNAASSEIAFERIELVHQGIVSVQNSAR